MNDFGLLEPWQTGVWLGLSTFGLYWVAVGCGYEERWAHVKGISEEELLKLGTDFM